MILKRLIFLIALFISLEAVAQYDSVIVKEIETVWDQGIPVCPEDEYISSLIQKIDLPTIRDGISLTEEDRKVCCEIGLAFYARNQFEAADWYLSKLITMPDTYARVHSIEMNSRVSALKELPYTLARPITIIKTIIKEKEPEVSSEDLATMKKDVEFLNSLPKSFDNLSKSDMKKLAKQIDEQLKKLILEKDSLIKAKATKEVITSKEGVINTLEKEKEIIDLNIQNEDLSGKNKLLDLIKTQYKTYLTWATIILAILILVLFILAQRKTIKSKDLEILKQLKDIIKKNTYLEHAAKLIRHDMHSGINTYMPRGINSLEKRISDTEAKNLKIDTSIKMIKEGLSHTQKVYKSVYEFTNLVKQNIVLEKTNINLKDLLDRYLLTTSYKSQVVIEDLVTTDVNETLFCNAIDNLIRNGLKYNDSDTKIVKIYMDKNYLVVEDNGRGMSPEEFNKHINKTDAESGIGLGISSSILNEHGFEMICEKVSAGTKLKIKLK